MRREQVIEGIEFGINDFQPMVRGIRSPSLPAQRPKRSSGAAVVIIFACLFVFIVVFFSILKNQLNPNDHIQRDQKHYAQTKMTSSMIQYLLS